MPPIRRSFATLLLTVAPLMILHAAEPEATSTPPAREEAAATEVLAGHSYHGEAFNEGPRQQAYLMDDCDRVQFPVTSEQPQAVRFVQQGVAQLHGFWYFEAERSFRQAAAIDPDCATAYWGMAMANTGNANRAKGFIAEAVERKGNVSRREQLYIEALGAYLKADPKKKKERAEAYTKALEKLLYEFPDDLEAKAFLALQLWNNRSAGVPIASHLAVDALMEQVLEVEPLHPVHHYRIHLWDYERPETALSSAARCGQALPAIAHMWHMPGHIYSRVKRYNDAVWQQEASARTDHAHMMRDRVLPDQIHNFAHNNEWLIRNLNHVGRFRDAVDLAKNMIELPRHPKYNTLSKRGSTQYGRMRLFETLSRYELWEEMIQLCNTPYLEPTDDKSEQIKRLRHLGRAYFGSGQPQAGAEQLAELRRRLDDETQQRDEAVEAAGDDEKKQKEARRRFASRISELEKASAELEGWQAAEDGQWKLAFEQFKKAGTDATVLARARLRAGEPDQAIADARKHVGSHENEVQPLAALVELLWEADQRDDALQAFKQLVALSGSLDLDSPVFQRIAPVAAELGQPGDWRIARTVPDDVGDRPPLESLGPFRWEPSPAPDWSLETADGTLLTRKHFQGQPLVLIFYLGHGCLHCAEQLQAFAPKVATFREAGFEVVAVSSDPVDELNLSVQTYEGGDLPMTLLSNAELDVFRAYRCYDDFEQQPLHGTFVIDGNGFVRWQDISYEPFMDPDFVLTETKRLLAHDEAAATR